MSYRVRTDNFEGPFDLLLYLVSRQRVDIGTVSIAEIVDQYLDEVTRMTTLDLDVASDFLLVASTLLEIKAASLVPRDTDETVEEIAQMTPSEAREKLIARLVEYKQYKNVAQMLDASMELEARKHPRPYGPDEEFTRAMPDFLRGVTIDGLALLAVSVYARRERALLESEHIAAKPIPVELHVRALHKKISTLKRMRFSDMVDSKTPTPIVVVTFLAVLELYKRSMVEITQDAQFGDIDIKYIEGSGELSFDDESVDAY